MKKITIIITVLICSCNGSITKYTTIENRDYWEFKKLGIDRDNNFYELEGGFRQSELDSIKETLNKMYIDWALTKKNQLIVPKDRVPYNVMAAVYWSVKRTPFEKKRDSINNLSNPH